MDHLEVIGAGRPIERPACPASQFQPPQAQALSDSQLRTLRRWSQAEPPQSFVATEGRPVDPDQLVAYQSPLSQPAASMRYPS